MKPNLAIIDIDGTIARFPDGCLPIPIADPEECFGISCRYFDSGTTGAVGCLRTSVCQHADQNHINLYFNSETILALQVRGNAVSVLRQLEAERWFLAYVSGRPKTFQANTARWLSNNGFPRGLVVCAGTPDAKFMTVNFLVGKLLPRKIICLEDDIITRERYIQLWGMTSEFERIVPEEDFTIPCKPSKGSKNSNHNL